MLKKPILLLAALLFAGYVMGQYASGPRFKALAIYSENVEYAHVEFAREAVKYFRELTSGEGYILDVSTDMNDLTRSDLADYNVIIMLNNVPGTPAQRAAFEKYMTGGGGWLGFHVAAYNDRNTGWDWFVDFLGGGVFWRNSWPAVPAKLVVENSKHPVCKGLPQSFISPENEWYQWSPSPRQHPDVEVLLSLSPDNYPLGVKDIIPDGDLPVVWTNKKYRMVYLNMGHGMRIFNDATQNYLIINSLRWVVAQDKKGDPFK